MGLSFQVLSITKGVPFAYTPMTLIQKGGLRIISTYSVGSINTAIRQETLQITY